MENTQFKNKSPNPIQLEYMPIKTDSYSLNHRVNWQHQLPSIVYMFNLQIPTYLSDDEVHIDLFFR